MAVYAKSVADAALFDLGSYGPEKKLTTDDATTSFFTQASCCARHTNFALAEFDFTFDQGASLIGRNSWQDGLQLTAKLPRHGTLMVGTFINVKLQKLGITSGTITRPDPQVGDTAQLNNLEQDLWVFWCEEVGNALIRELTWKASSQAMDRHTSESLHIMHQTKHEDGVLLNQAIGRLRNGTAYTNATALRMFAAKDRQLYIPVPISPALDAHNAFPVVAMNNSPVEFDVVLRGRDNLIVSYYKAPPPAPDYYQISPTVVTGGRILDIGMTAVCVFCDHDEETAFANLPVRKYYQYMQRAPTARVAANATSTTIDTVPFNHAVSEFMVLYRADSRTDANTRNAQPGVTASVGPLIAGALYNTPPRLEYFNFATDLSAALRPGSVTAAGTPTTGDNQDENPFAVVDLSANASQPRFSRPGVWMHEVDPFQRGMRRCESYLAQKFFAMQPADEANFSGAYIIGRSNQNPVNIQWEFSNAATTGLLEAGEIQCYGRTQNFYTIIGGQLQTQWAA